MSKFIINSEEVTKELIDEMIPLLEQHRQELTAYKDIKLNVSYSHYINAYNCNMFRAFIARDSIDNSIVGYVCYFIHANLHYSDYVYAVQDVLYVSKDKRGAMLGKKLLKYSEESMKETHNISVVTQHVKTFFDIGSLLESIGYKFVEKLYMKRVQ